MVTKHRTGHNSASVRPIAKNVLQTGKYGKISQLNSGVEISSRRSLVGMVTELIELQHKIGYNSANIRETVKSVASNRVFEVRRYTGAIVLI